jgi:macrolide-specific efflux system membrane fusion protein
MKKRTWIILLVVVVLAAVAVLVVLKNPWGANTGEGTREVRPEYNDISVFVSTTGVVEPQNRLELKPAVSGRIEEILVREGDRVSTGQVLARMSSTERATLLDAARSQGEETLRHWEEVYKATPIISPIDGEVIVRAVEPGQTVATTTPVLVLSDRLIVKAQVDETDIGKIKIGQKAVISLDAYPETRITAAVDHIAYESETVNNVTIYEVDILPDKVPPVFRSGMSANVEITEQSRQHVLTLPEPAIKRMKKKTFVLVSRGPGKEPERREVELGLSDGERVEIVSGLSGDEQVLVSSEAYTPPRESEGGSPFSPWSRRRSR